MKLLLAVAVALAGCSTAASAVGSLIKPRPPEVTVVTNVMVPAPAAPAEHHDGPGKAMVAGALAGGVAAVIVRTTPAAVASGVLVGAGVGYVVHAISD